MATKMLTISRDGKQLSREESEDCARTSHRARIAGKRVRTRFSVRSLFRSSQARSLVLVHSREIRRRYGRNAEIQPEADALCRAHPPDGELHHIFLAAAA